MVKKHTGTCITRMIISSCWDYEEMSTLIASKSMMLSLKIKHSITHHVAVLFFSIYF